MTLKLPKPYVSFLSRETELVRYMYVSLSMYTDKYVYLLWAVGLAHKIV